MDWNQRKKVRGVEMVLIFKSNVNSLQENIKDLVPYGPNHPDL